MGAFDCPVCEAVRHIDDNAEPECCWFCRWPVECKGPVSDDERVRRLRGARIFHGDASADALLDTSDTTV